MQEKIRILIADDHAVVRQGLRIMLEPKNDFDLVGEADNGKDLVDKCHKLQPDMVILDLIMPKMGGVQAIQAISKQKHRPKILVLTSYSEEKKVIDALKAGANGYILKESSPEELVRAIHATMQGEMWIYPNLAPKVLEKLIHPGQDTADDAGLTKKEVEVIKLVAKGISNTEIAHNLNINESTVRFHMSNIFSKLGYKNRTQLALFALREGIATLDDEK
jgi:DNA-binding NarL/FixJ family response regulator